MCQICGCGIDAGSTEALFAKNYKCQSCGHNFMGIGVIVTCTRCKSRNVKHVKLEKRG